MAGLEEATPSPRPRRRPSGLTAGESAIVDSLDDVKDEVRALREKAPSPKVLIGALLVLVGMFFASQVYMVGLIATSRGVDVAPAADAAKKVIPTTEVSGG